MADRFQPIYKKLDEIREVLEKIESNTFDTLKIMHSFKKKSSFRK
jgi:hypothetical protein